MKKKKEKERRKQGKSLVATVPLATVPPITATNKIYSFGLKKLQ